jgi:hypothetical protein
MADIKRTLRQVVATTVDPSSVPVSEIAFTKASPIWLSDQHTPILGAWAARVLMDEAVDQCELVEKSYRMAFGENNQYPNNEGSWMAAIMLETCGDVDLTAFDEWAADAPGSDYTAPPQIAFVPRAPARVVTLTPEGQIEMPEQENSTPTVCSHWRKDRCTWWPDCRFHHPNGQKGHTGLTSAGAGEKPSERRRKKPPRKTASRQQHKSGPRQDKRGRKGSTDARQEKRGRKGKQRRSYPRGKPSSTTGGAAPSGRR